jgi:Zn-finger nucleic acid-binding protein
MEERFMKCPRCETTALKAEEMRGLSVDACPDCQGVWVRRRDLEALAGRQGDTEDSRQPAREEDRRVGGRKDDDDDDEFGGRGGQGQPKGKRKGGWLQNLGDVFGGD